MEEPFKISMPVYGDPPHLNPPPLKGGGGDEMKALRQ